MKCYLAGPILYGNQDAYHKTHDWRNRVTKELGAAYVRNPALRTYEKGDLQLVQDDKDEIQQCTILLAYCWTYSPGTSMEVIYSWMCGLDVIVVADTNRWEPWYEAHSHKIFKTLDEAIVYIKQQYIDVTIDGLIRVI
jgi:hypothetical protein